MTRYFSGFDAEQIALIVENAEMSGYHSKRDKCWVMLAKCEKCGCMYEEEMEAAKKMLLKEREFFCLSCDSEGYKPAFVGITIEFGFFSE